MMTILVLIAFICGLNGLVNIIGFIGPVIVIFSLLVGFIILFENLDGLKNISQAMTEVNLTKAGGNCIKSGVLYTSYNMVSGLFFFTALANSANNKEEAKLGATVGSLLLMIVILVMNFALLSKIKNIYILQNPYHPYLVKFFRLYCYVEYFLQLHQIFGQCAIKYQKKEDTIKKLLLLSFQWVHF